MGALLSNISIRNNEEEEEKKEEKSSLEQQANGMQEVYDSIWMGSMKAAQNLSLLKHKNITHILAIGWNLTANFPNEFEYKLVNKIEDTPTFLIISKFSECFQFMDECLNNNKNKLLVHCHKGLSRSATIIIAYKMWKEKKDVETVLGEIRKNRGAFVMPNIGFQAQLHEFQNQQYSLDMTKYHNFDVIGQIESILPSILSKIKEYYTYYEKDLLSKVDDQDLFAKTMYIHQVHKLREKDKLPQESDIIALNESIKYLRMIQVNYIKDEKSIKRFDVMFKSKYVQHDVQ